jgi:MarR-like DNA-binding transcriptional regulator SgrR of sgrS sRNA
MGFATSFAVRRAARALYARGESVTMVMVLSTLADFANIDDNTCWMAVSNIAKECDCTQRYARSLLSDAVAKGYVEETGRKHRSGTKVYRILEQTFIDIKEWFLQTLEDVGQDQEVP